MRKTGIMMFLILMMGSIGGCGTENGTVEEPQWEMEDTEKPSNDAGGGREQGSADGVKGAAGADNETESVQGETSAYADLVEGLIAEQSFETELDSWGKVFFASAAPSEDGEPPHFMLLMDKDVVYTFPETAVSVEDKFAAVSAVSFQDYNKDGRQDVLVLATYTNGGREWNEPVIFLQNNTDNMFYLDHPDLESYRVEAPAENGAGFYRDTFLEEYLRKQGVTDSIPSLAEYWIDYVEYADSLSGSFSTDLQIAAFAANREIWAAGMDYANEIHRFTLANLGYNGKLTLIAANQGGTGNYTYSEFYQIDGKGEMQRLETSFREEDSQPDLMEDTMTVYSSFSKTGNQNHFVVYDMLKDGPNSQIHRVSSLSLENDYVLETPLASETILYETPDAPAQVHREDCNGNELTEEEYDTFADTYYSRMDMTKQTARFTWMDVSSLEGISDEETEDLLRRAYAGFTLE